MSIRDDGRWTHDRAWAWYDALPWLVGCNFIPSTAVNQLEMWQADTFDPATIDRELGWAQDLGLNTMRVFLHDLLWDDDAAGFTTRIDEYLSIASSHGIRTLFALFDDCWHGGAKLGPQPLPVPGRHNSRWLQSPGDDAVDHPDTWGRLEAYVTGVIGRFANDERVLAWDLYNEVTNLMIDQSLPPDERPAAVAAATERRPERMESHLRLFDLAFAWARAARPDQPLTAGTWFPDSELNARIVQQSDVVTFHNYGDAPALERHIPRLRRHKRPLICTEWMARTLGSRIDTHLPIFRRERIGCYTWGLVNGKTQTHIPWRPDPADATWFHDLLHADGAPYDEREAALIRQATQT
jgi:hypothetical protein